MLDLHEMAMAGRLIGGGGGSPAPEPTLITKTIAANGTYSAEDDNADGYSAVTVNVQPTEQEILDTVKTLYKDVLPLARDSARVAAAYSAGSGAAEYLLRSQTSTSNYIPAVYLNGTPTDDTYKRLSVTSAIESSSTTAVNKYYKSTGGIYPDSVVQERVLLNGKKVILNREVFELNSNVIHPAFTAIYSPVTDAWFDVHETDTVKFCDMCTLSGASSADNIAVIYGNNNIYAVDFGSAVPTFSGTSTYTIPGSPSFYRLSLSTNFGNKKAKATISAVSSKPFTSFSADDIRAATFDMYDSGNSLIFAKNADISDYVAT